MIKTILSAPLQRQAMFCAAGWVYIVMIVLAIVLFLAGVHLSFAALAATVSSSL